MKIFITHSLNKPGAALCCSHMSLSPVTREQRPMPLSQLRLFRKLQGTLRSPLSLLFFRLDFTVYLAPPHKICLPALLHDLLPFSAFKDLNSLFCIVETRTAHSTQDKATPLLNPNVVVSPLLTS